MQLRHITHLRVSWPLAIIQSRKRRETILRDMPRPFKPMAPILLIRLRDEVEMRPQATKGCEMSVDTARWHAQVGLEGPS